MILEAKRKLDHKKVLLRERKRDTTHRVASPWGGGGLLHLGWGVPILARGGTDLGRGYSTLARRVPHLGQGGYSSWLGVPTSASGEGTPP